MSRPVQRLKGSCMERAKMPWSYRQPCRCIHARTADSSSPMPAGTMQNKRRFVDISAFMRQRRSLAFGPGKPRPERLKRCRLLRIEDSHILDSRGDPDGFIDISAAEVSYFDPFTAQRLDGIAALRSLYDQFRGKINIESATSRRYATDPLSSTPATRFAVSPVPHRARSTL